MSTTRRHLPTAAISCLVVLATACGTTVSSAPSDDAAVAPEADGTTAPLGDPVPAGATDASAATAPNSAEPTVEQAPDDPTEADPAPASPADDNDSEPEAEPAAEPDPPATEPDPPADDPEEPTDPTDPGTPLPPIDGNGDFVLVEVAEHTMEPIPPKPDAYDAPDCGLVSTAPMQPGTVTAWALDARGDGTADDVVNVFYNGEWRVRLIAGNGAVSEYVLPDPGDEPPAVLGDVRLEGNDSEDFLVKVTSNGDHHLLGVFGATDDGCLFRYTYASGHGVVLSVRDTPDLEEGVWCAASVGQYRAERRANGNWDWFMTSLALTDPTTLDWTQGWGGDDVPSSELNPVGFDCLGHTL